MAAAVLLVLAPPATLFTLGRLFPVRQRAPIAFQPPPWVFGVVWSVLSVLLGVVTALAYRDTPTVLLYYVTVLALWSLWIVVNYHGRSVVSLVLLILSGLTLAFYASHLSRTGHLVSSCLLLGLGLTWLMCATALNGVEAQRSLEDN